MEADVDDHHSSGLVKHRNYSDGRSSSEGLGYVGGSTQHSRGYLGAVGDHHFSGLVEVVVGDQAQRSPDLAEQRDCSDGRSSPENEGAAFARRSPDSVDLDRPGVFDHRSSFLEEYFEAAVLCLAQDSPDFVKVGRSDALDHSSSPEQ